MLRQTASPGSRAITPVVGILVFLVITVLLATTVAAGLVTVAPTDPDLEPAFDLSVTAADGSITIDYLRGEPIDVREVTLSVTVDGDPLDEQPPVPFFAANGYEGGPTGPFNEAADPHWVAPETAGFRLAETNEPLPDPGDEVAVTIVVENEPVAEKRTTAE